MSDKSDLKPKTDNKLLASSISAAITTILIWIFSVVPPHVEIPGEVGAALTTVIGFIFGLVMPSRK